MATAEKLRDSAWWLTTLEPYKKLEARFQAASVQASQAQGKHKAGASHMQMYVHNPSLALVMDALQKHPRSSSCCRT